MEICDAIAEGRLKPDGQVLLENGDIKVTKIAIDPVWYIPDLLGGLVLMNMNLDE